MIIVTLSISPSYYSTLSFALNAFASVTVIVSVAFYVFMRVSRASPFVHSTSFTADAATLPVILTMATYSIPTLMSHRYCCLLG